MGAILCSRRSAATKSMVAMAGLVANDILENADTPTMQRQVRPEVPKWGWCDTYAMVMMAALSPLAGFMYLFTTAACFPLFVLGKIYMTLFVARPANNIHNAVIFKLLLLVTFPWAFYIYAVAYAYWVFVWAFCMVAALPVTLVRVLLLGQGGRILRNFALMWPYMRGNYQSYYMTAVAILGQLDRQSLMEFTFGRAWSFPPGGFATAVAFIPLIKYTWHANPLLWCLDEVFCNQWTPPFEELSENDVIRNVRIFITRFMHAIPERRVIDKVKFAAHYPWPPGDFKKRECVIGLQWPAKSKFVLLPQIIFTVDGQCSYDGLVGVKCKSEDGKTGIVEVLLWWWGYHFLTGRVEVNYRNDKGLEHPMWCLMAKDSYLAMVSYSWVSDLFARFSEDVVQVVQRLEVTENAGTVRVLPGGIPIPSTKRPANFEGADS